jgi:hypothetical protein
VIGRPNHKLSRNCQITGCRPHGGWQSQKSGELSIQNNGLSRPFRLFTLPGRGQLVADGEAMHIFLVILRIVLGKSAPHLFARLFAGLRAIIEALRYFPFSMPRLVRALARIGHLLSALRDFAFITSLVLAVLKEANSPLVAFLPASAIFVAIAVTLFLHLCEVDSRWSSMWRSISRFMGWLDDDDDDSDTGPDLRNR